MVFHIVIQLLICESNLYYHFNIIFEHFLYPDIWYILLICHQQFDYVLIYMFCLAVFERLWQQSGQPLPLWQLRILSHVATSRLRRNGATVLRHAIQDVQPKVSVKYVVVDTVFILIYLENILHL